MKAFYVLLITTIIASAVNCEGIKYDELNVPAFGIGDENFEEKVYQSLQANKNAFEKISELEPYATLAMDTFEALAPKVFEKAGKFLAKAIPFADVALGIASGLVEIFKDDDNTDWRAEFAKFLAQEMPKELAKEKVRDVRTFSNVVLENIGNMEKSLSKRAQGLSQIEEYRQNDPFRCNTANISLHMTLINTENDKYDNIEGVATNLHTYFQTWVQTFIGDASTFKEYPLIAAPVLIEMAMLISTFEPLVMELTHYALDVWLSCKIRDGLMNYLPYVIEARLAAIEVDQSIMIKVRNEPYNETGYNHTDTLNCWVDACSISGFEKVRKVASEIIDALDGNSRVSNTTCLIDDLGRVKYQHVENDDDCAIGYAQYLRHKIEKMFRTPIEVSNAICNQPLGKPTGNQMNSVNEN